jgi:hypothetical protein
LKKVILFYKVHFFKPETKCLNLPRRRNPVQSAVVNEYLAQY